MVAFLWVKLQSSFIPIFAGLYQKKKQKNICEKAEYNELGRTITIQLNEQSLTESYIAIISAGTSDLPVVEEAVETAKILGNYFEIHLGEEMP